MAEISHSASGPLLPLLPGCFEMDQDSSSKLMASSHERHLKRTKNLPPQKWQQQPPQPPQPRRPGGGASSNKPRYSLDWSVCTESELLWRDSIPWQIIIQGPTNRSGIWHRPARKMRMLIGTVTKTHYELIAWIRHMNSWYELIQWWIHTMNSYTMN